MYIINKREGYLRDGQFHPPVKSSLEAVRDLELVDFHDENESPNSNDMNLFAIANKFLTKTDTLLFNFRDEIKIRVPFGYPVRSAN